MNQTLEDLQIRYENPITINYDNTSGISISKNPIMQSKTKHIPIKYHFLRDRVAQKVVKIVYVDTKEQIADILTKPLSRSNFENIRQKLGVIPYLIKNYKSFFRRKKHMDRGNNLSGGALPQGEQINISYVIDVKGGG